MSSVAMFDYSNQVLHGLLKLITIVLYIGTCYNLTALIECFDSCKL